MDTVGDDRVCEASLDHNPLPYSFPISLILLLSILPENPS